MERSFTPELPVKRLELRILYFTLKLSQAAWTPEALRQEVGAAC